jgi:hypothetical protein
MRSSEPLYYGDYLQIEKVRHGARSTAPHFICAGLNGGCLRAAHVTPFSPHPFPPCNTRAPQLLSCQLPKSREAGAEAHEEMLFITTHQVYELLFKQVLHELDSLRAIFTKNVRAGGMRARASDGGRGRGGRHTRGY